jgi:hypothetical protein
MSSSPARPKALKAALIAVEAAATAVTSTATVFSFQYNPHALTRTFSYLNADGTPLAEAKAPPNEGSPVELIYLTLELDATDQLERPEQNVSVAQNGLHPALATLESMMSLPTASASKAEPKVVLFFWGPKRLLPARLVSLKVSEEAFDLGLNPVRVSIDLCLRVMQLSELKTGSVGYTICRNNKTLNDTLVSLYRQSIGDSVLSQVSGQAAKVTTVTTAAATGTAVSGTSSKVGVSTVVAKKKTTLKTTTKK